MVTAFEPTLVPYTLKQPPALTILDFRVAASCTTELGDEAGCLARLHRYAAKDAAKGVARNMALLLSVQLRAKDCLVQTQRGDIQHSMIPPFSIRDNRLIDYPCGVEAIAQQKHII